MHWLNNMTETTRKLPVGKPYQDLMKLQHVTHPAVRENDFSIKQFVWEQRLPFFFYFNKKNYASYEAYYAQQLTRTNRYQYLI